MDKQKEIEKMAKTIPSTIIAYNGNPQGQHLYGEQREEIATILVNEGYGDVNNAVREFAEKLKETADDVAEIGIGHKHFVYTITNHTIDKLVKEVLGE